MKGLHIMDVPLLLSVWILCVATDWSTGTKIALNIAAVAALCLKEVLLHRHLQRHVRPAAAAAAACARRPAYAAA